MRVPVALALVVVLLATPAFAGVRSGATGPTPSTPVAPMHSGPVAAASLAPAHDVPRSVPSHPAGSAHGRATFTGDPNRFPHPAPRPAAAPAYSGHYYAGTVFNGTNFTSTQLSATIAVPLDVAQATDFYYVILSVWDNASSYDQLGFANANGVFGVAYSTTDYCANNYYYSPSAFPLTPGTTYNFSMLIRQGTVTFSVAAPNGTVVWSLAQTTGGRYFVDSAFYSCYYAPFGNTTSFYDYTDYEEVYGTLGNVPPYDFFFGQNLADLRGVTGFAVFTTPPLPGPITVPINGDNAVIANEPYNVYLNQANSSYAIVSPKTAKTFPIALGVSAVAATGSVQLSTFSVPSGWSVSLSAVSGTPPFTYTGHVTVPSGAPYGNYTIGFNATDSSGDPNQLSVWFQVVPPLSVAVRVGPHAQADLGQTITISAVPGGGLGGLGFAWSGLPAGCAGSTQTLRCAPTVTGTFLISVIASDGAGDTAVSPTLSLVVNPDPVVTVVVSPSSTDVNQTVQWYSTAVSGSGGFGYAWLGLFTGCTSVGATATCTPAAPGDYALRAVATDAAGFSVTSTNATVHILAPPKIALSLSRYTVDAHQPIQLSALATGGAGGYSYTWTGLPPGCSASAPVATCAFGTPGNYLVTVVAYDTYQVSTSVARAYVTVTADPVVALSAGAGSVDLGQTAHFTVQVSGGAPGYTYAFVHLPSGCSSANASALSCTPASAASYANLSVAVTDRNAWTVTSSINFTVFVRPTVALSIAPATATAGTAIEFLAHTTGGSGGVAYAWSNLPGGCQAAPSATIDCTPSGNGATTVTVTATDSNGVATSATGVVTVTPAPSALGNPWPYVGLGVSVIVAVAVVLWARRRRAAAAAVADGGELAE